MLIVIGLMFLLIIALLLILFDIVRDIQEQLEKREEIVHKGKDEKDWFFTITGIGEQGNKQQQQKEKGDGKWLREDAETVIF